MAVQLTLLDGDTGGKRSSLELLAGGVVGLPEGLPNGTFDGEPLVWDAGTTSWVPRASVTVDSIDAQDVAGPGSSLLLLRGRTVIDREDALQVGYLAGSATHIFYALVGGATALKYEADDATATLKLRFYDNGTPAARPSITGATPTDALESVIAALVALGLVTDDR